MGHRMELYVQPRYAKTVIEISKSFGIDAKIIGRVEKGKGKKVTVESELGSFTY
jgi:phosphoribosylformylglycinamidine cyclo-ligase